jgi:hypothetical protein
MEPLEVVEIDPDQALLRSTEPDATEDGIYYYEVWVKPGELSLERFHAERGSRREPRAVDLTWEQAGRFVRDVEQVYAEPPASEG